MQHASVSQSGRVLTCRQQWTAEENEAMSATIRLCPFCNAESPIPAGTRDGARVPCIRCGEAFVYHGPEVAAGSGPPPSAVVNAAAPRRSNRAIALGILGVMA